MASLSSEKSAPRPLYSVVVLGPLGCGKSTLVGKLLDLGGLVPKESFEAILREGLPYGRGLRTYEYSWVVDKSKDARVRGLTLDMSVHMLTVDDVCVNLVHTPGHPKYLKNRLAGISQADYALLVVNLEQGGFAPRKLNELDQMLLCLRGCGIMNLAIACNVFSEKPDGDLPLSPLQFEDSAGTLRGLLDDNGYSPDLVPIFPISGFTGDNLVTPSPRLTWFKGWVAKFGDESTTRRGMCLLDVLRTWRTPPRSPKVAPLRIQLFQIARVQGLVTSCGKLLSGNLKVSYVAGPFFEGKNICGFQYEIKSVFVSGKPVDMALPGDLVSFSVKGASINDFLRGDICFPLGHPSSESVVSSFLAEVVCCSRSRVIYGEDAPIVYCHGSHTLCKLRVRGLIDPDTKTLHDDHIPVHNVRHGQRCLVECIPTKKLYVEKYSPTCPSLGSVLLADHNSIFGHGIVVDVFYKEKASLQEGGKNNSVKSAAKSV